MLDTYYIISFIIIGLMFGSFFNVVGLRLPEKKSIIFPASHCPNCDHKLSWFELIPVLSYIFLLGKCKNCRKRISVVYPIIELTTAVLFVLSYLTFGLNIELLFALIFISGLIIIIISDFKYMVIPDEIIVITVILLIIVGLFIPGIDILMSLFNGVVVFLLMWLIKILGDKAFKKESLGGGDVKLMFLLGFVLGFEIAIVLIFVASLIALPIALFLLLKKNVNILPFGPFLSISAIGLFLLQVEMLDIIILLFLK